MVTAAHCLAGAGAATLARVTVMLGEYDRTDAVRPVRQQSNNLYNTKSFYRSRNALRMHNRRKCFDV